MVQQNKILTRGQIMFGGTLGGPFIGGFFMMLLLFEMNKKPLGWLAWVLGLLFSYFEVQWAGNQCRSGFAANIHWILILLSLHAAIFYLTTYFFQEEQENLISKKYELFSWNSVITMTLISLLFHSMIIHQMGRIINPIYGVEIAPYEV